MSKLTLQRWSSKKREKGQGDVRYGQTKTGPGDQQEINYIEERDGKMWACEMKWPSKAKASFSKTFTQAYPEHALQLIHRENYYEWLAGG